MQETHRAVACRRLAPQGGMPQVLRSACKTIWNAFAWVPRKADAALLVDGRSASKQFEGSERMPASGRLRRAATPTASCCQRPVPSAMPNSEAPRTATTFTAEVRVSFSSAICTTRVRERFARWTGEYWCCWAPTLQQASQCDWRGPSTGYLWGHLDAGFTRHDPGSGGPPSTC